MDLINESPLRIAWPVGKTDPPAWSMTCIVKGTFVLSHNGTAVLAEEQLDLSGDENAGDDPDGVLVFPDDFSWNKPRTDLLLIGACYAPGSQPVSRAFASFQVGPHAKTLLVSGDRKWTTFGGATEPEPFQRMELTYERAFGGPAFKPNPLGKGFVDPAEFDEAGIYPLPNIENPRDPVMHPAQPVEPAGFAPIPQTWPLRVNKMGTFDDKWLNSRWPWYPEDFDYAFFNSAPEDQQTPYLRGDEEIYAENLHATHPGFRCQLPGIRPRCFVRELVQGRFTVRELPLALDTVWVNVETLQLVLTWRGLRPVRSDKLLEFSHLFLTAEWLADPVRPTEEYADVLAAALIRRANQEADDFDIEQPEEVEEEPEEEDVEEEEEEKDHQDPQEEDEVEEEQFAKPTTPPAADARTEFSSCPTSGAARTQVAVVTVPPRSPTGAELTQEMIATLEQASQRLTEMGKKVPDALLAALAKPVKIPDEPAEEDESEEPDSDSGEVPGAELDLLTREQIIGKITRRQSLAEHDLTGMDLAGQDLTGMDLREAILQDARLSRCVLNGADFSGAFIAHADLRQAGAKGAIFADADFTSALMGEADLSGADLSGADLSRADLRFANLEGIRAQGVVLAEADLSHANLKKAQLNLSDLSGCRLHGTNLEGANLTGVVLEHAWGRGLQANRAILANLGAAKTVFPDASFEGVEAVDSAWDEAQLYAANFAGARLNKAGFSGAYLGHANFSSAEMRKAVFDEARLHDVSAVRTNFLGASLIATDLENADLRESNFYGANLRETSLARTKLAGANLRMTVRTTEAK